MKTCQKEGCENRVWGGGYCTWHQHLRSDKKPKGFNPRKPSGEKSLFDELWEERMAGNGNHYSEISGKQLDSYYDTQFYVDMFIHVLDKKNYPKFRLKKDNIWLGTPYEHLLIDQGTKNARETYEKENHCSFEKFYKKRQELKEEYNGES